MRKKSIFVILTLLILTLSTVTAVQAYKDGRIKILWNGNTELVPSENDAPLTKNDRIYVPAYLLRQANFSVQLTNQTLTIRDNRFKYLTNLSILDRLQRDFTSSYNEFDEESLNILGKILLKEPVNTTKLQESVDAVDKAINSFDELHLAYIVDRPDEIFTFAGERAENSKLAAQKLISYIKSNDPNDLKEFLAYKDKANEANSRTKIAVGQYFNRSLEKTLH
ncbi:hypothetical protein EJP77_10340 [Paenibacillus zeisoli]|uniref:Copper amine oxidase-like N-terminal domain-containing protein n=1 Tax=Paenibacillus zeisoli TaxID=2496267 RepID=A0A433XCI2_9BACL|nr:hypothetical protein [Paenibacillus zeisoli]RUT31776.1 hypothetical protein EJP77_10340 [Paenibacillus zeisoli]